MHHKSSHSLSVPGVPPGCALFANDLQEAPPVSTRELPIATSEFFDMTLQRFQAKSEERVTFQSSAAASAQLPTEKITVASKCVLSATPAWFFGAAENKEAPLLTNARHFGATPGGSEMLRKWD